MLGGWCVDWGNGGNADDSGHKEHTVVLACDRELKRAVWSGGRLMATVAIEESLGKKSDKQSSSSSSVAIACFCF